VREDVVTIEPFGMPGVRRTMLNSGAPVRDSSGNLVGAVIAQMNISERIRAEERLREADRRKDELIAMLAHELRNPLAPVRTAAHIIRKLAPDDARIARAADIIDRQVSHMTTMIDDLLDASRIARGKVSLQRTRNDLTAIVRQTLDDYRADLGADGIALTFDAPRAPL
jgi:signal transduction histidine kinase